MDAQNEEAALVQRLVTAIADLDLVAVRNLLKNVSPRVQEETTGRTPLHVAVIACVNHPEQKDDAFALVTTLLNEGAIWNELDANGDTPGCVAYRAGLMDVYELIVSAGVRAELLFNRLSEMEENDDKKAARQPGSVIADIGVSKGGTTGGPSDGQDPAEDYIDHWDSNADFLRSSLKYTDSQLLDSSSNAVMMDWETNIMEKHASNLLPEPGLRVMNIGHGMGIVDSAIQTHSPKEHHIVEAHPAVLQQMKKSGWYEKENVIVHEGRWQDVLDRLVADGVELDAIYYDTFAESYEDLKDLFSEKVIGLLTPAGRFSFYNGLGADRQVCYDVYKNVVEIDLLDAGLETQWEEIPVPTIDWQGVRRSYWNVPVYWLPTCTFIG